MVSPRGPTNRPPIKPHHYKTHGWIIDEQAS